ncbi:MAG: efflux RND transporter periplasmic adaptor subunit [Opitutaceae bacterium]|nr:efflux RND transporter periplasmic adaptor subunit [Opitutaceae bacterium]
MKPASLVLGVALSLAFAGCARREPKVIGNDGPAVAVRAVAVQREIVPARLETSGTVRAVQRATIAAKVSGVIASLPLALGQSVEAGDVLLTIAASELAERVAQVRAQLLETERELARERTLQASGAGTIDAVKSLEDRLAQTQAALREAETLRSYATVRAPFAGVVARKHVEAGDFAVPGAPLLQLDGRDAFEIETGLPESLAASLAPGAVLEIGFAGSAEPLRATLAELSSAADPATRTVTAKLAVPAGAPVRAGQFVRVLVPSAPVTMLLVPANAVATFGQMERVFVVGENGRASLRLVKTGARVGDRVQVVSGLDAADRVVISPSSLRDGQPLILTP